MIEINLLPEELKKRKRATPKIDVTNISLEKIPFIKIALVAAGIVVGIQVALFGFGIFGRIILGTLEKNYKQVLPKKKEAEQLKSQISNMGKKVSAIDELMVKRFSWAKKLNDLNDSVTPGIWLTQLDYDERIVEKPKAAPNVSKGHESKVATEKVLERYLIISGAASSMGEEGTALIGRFIKSLKENASFYSDFSDIEFASIKREQIAGQEIMTFKITCLFKIK
jgi:hypothetical protein